MFYYSNIKNLTKWLLLESFKHSPKQKFWGYKVYSTKQKKKKKKSQTQKTAEQKAMCPNNPKSEGLPSL